VVKEILYDSFGKILSDTNPAMWVPLGFGFGLHDRDTGWVRMGWRDYDPETGRFTALDPIGYAGGDSDLYGYCVDDPVNFIDPPGLGKFKIVKRIGQWGLKQLREVSREQAKKALNKGTDIQGSKKQMKKLLKEKGKNNTSIHSVDETGRSLKDGLKPETHGDGAEHYHPRPRNGGHGFLNGTVPGATLGKDVFGDNVVGEAVDFFNPLSDAQDMIDTANDVYDYFKKQ
jgi:RHS repeat-associated protein